MRLCTAEAGQQLASTFGAVPGRLTAHTTASAARPSLASCPAHGSLLDGHTDPAREALLGVVVAFASRSACAGLPGPRRLAGG